MATATADKKENEIPIVKPNPYEGKPVDELWSTYKGLHIPDEKTGSNPLVKMQKDIRETELSLSSIINKELIKLHGSNEQEAPKGTSMKNNREAARKMLHTLLYTAIKMEHGDKAADLYIKDPDYIETLVGRFSGGQHSYDSLLKHLTEADDLTKDDLLSNLIGTMAANTNGHRRKISKLEQELTKLENYGKVKSLSERELGYALTPQAKPDFAIQKIKEKYARIAQDHYSKQQLIAQKYVQPPEPAKK